MEIPKHTTVLSTNVQIAEIYSKTLDCLIMSNPSIEINESLLLNNIYFNTLYLMVKNIVFEWIKTNHRIGGDAIRKKRKGKTMRKRKYKFKKSNKTLGRKYYVGGRSGNRKWVMDLIHRIFLAILMMLFMRTKHVLSIYPEYDNDVIDRINSAGEIRELFNNIHGTCVPNTALFLGSINIETYSEITQQIIENKKGLTFSQAGNYLNSSLLTLWGWETIYNDDLIVSDIPQLRGSLELYRRQKIRKYIDILKQMLIEMKNSMDIVPQQGILTAVLYPSGSVQHAVVAWLSSDNHLVIIDPQEFVRTKRNVLFVDDVSMFPENPNYSTLSLENYFMTYLDENREKGETVVLRNMHVRMEENLEQINKNNPMVIDIINNMKLLTDA